MPSDALHAFTKKCQSCFKPGQNISLTNLFHCISVQNKSKSQQIILPECRKDQRSKVHHIIYHHISRIQGCLYGCAARVGDH